MSSDLSLSDSDLQRFLLVDSSGAVSSDSLSDNLSVNSFVVSDSLASLSDMRSVSDSDNSSGNSSVSNSDFSSSLAAVSSDLDSGDLDSVSDNLLSSHDW